jgi:hypothetical protein
MLGVHQKNRNAFHHPPQIKQIFGTVVTGTSAGMDFAFFNKKEW